MKASVLIILALAILPLTGCVGGLAKNLKALGDDPAIVVGNISSVYGTVKLVRIGGTTNSVVINPDGTVSVNK